jgi:tetratricopeptide (TPR) repeat protein
MHKKSLAIAEAQRLQEDIAAAYGNLGVIYQRRGNLDMATTMYQKSLAIETPLARKEGMAAAYNNLGQIYLDRRDLDQAETMFRKALIIKEPLGLKEDIINCCEKLVLIYLWRHQSSRVGPFAPKVRTRNLIRAIAMRRKSLAIKETFVPKGWLARKFFNFRIRWGRCNLGLMMSSIKGYR